MVVVKYMLGRKRRRLIEDTLRASQEMVESRQKLDAIVRAYEAGFRFGIKAGARARELGAPDE